MAQSRMRYLVLSVGLVGVVGLAACGGDAPAVTPPPPPPPPPVRTATTVTAVAGTGQSVAAGQAAPVAPAVIVRDAEGNPFAGATVQFTVTDGGGSLEGATPVSGADGVARVTRWTVGVIGTQRISAVVGALAPVTIDATIIPNSDAITTSVPTTGGVVAITTSGHPYKGLKLTIPTGTVSATVNWEMRLLPNLTLPTLPTGYRVGGAILEISNDAPQGAKLMTLDVPITRPAGEGLVLAFYDPVRGVMEVLPTVAQSDTSTRVVTTHLRADLLMGRPVTGVLARLGGAGTAGALVPITFSLPQPTAQAAFNAATDAWPVLDYGAED
ncbi:MAG: Ig-like domain-containing protein, partial [Gemmatimonadaceae bacterium]|nr:Ig-like domain-containing protein [Gemmatimonadaceae bacterium]